MRSFSGSVVRAVASALLAGVAILPAQAQQAERVPIDVWALRDIVSTVDVSPDGKHLLVLKRESKEGENVLEVYDTSDMSKPLRRLNADPMEFISARWVSDNHIFGNAWQVVRKSVTRPEEDVRSYKTYSYNVDDNKFADSEGNFSIVKLLPREPNSILVSMGRDNSGGLGVDPLTAFRPRSYYRYDLTTGARSLVLKGNEKFPTAEFDNDGNPRFTSSVERGTNLLRYFYRLPGDGSWSEYSESYDLDDPDNLYRVLGDFQGLVGTNAEDPTIGYVIDSRGSDKAALWEFDFKTGQFGKKLYENPDADVIDISLVSTPGSDKLAAAIYPGEKYERYWFDEGEKALFANLREEIPFSHQISISSRSRDGKTMVVRNSGPHDPGSFWLVKDGALGKLGSTNPLVKPEQLSDVEFIKYPARDGKMVPAYLTKPKGSGPFPLVVLPHGGPHVTEVVGYDEWGQLLANAGYMVLQPEYRMSVGWGQDHFDSAYGQHGLAMQDDKDDGAKYLVEQGLADPDRIAMFGWSYGGYAALVATTREPNIYQCAIAGAAVADAAKVYQQRKNPYSPKALDDWSQRRGMIGINPIDEVAKSNIPLLMVHGDVDARVRYFNMEDYHKAMDKAGKTNAQYLTLKGADHFSSTLMYNHQKQFYTKLLDFLANDCGPGGL